jgi:hypothetical protein
LKSEEAKRKQPRTQQSKTGSSCAQPDHPPSRSDHPKRDRDSPGHTTGSFSPYRIIRPQGRIIQNNQEKSPAGQLQTFDRWISQTTWRFETKFWGDGEHPKERLCPKNYSLKLPTTPGIANHSQEHYELGFIQKSTNRRPNPVFEGSRSSTKRHKALTHDPLKEILRETPSNRLIE